MADRFKNPEKIKRNKMRRKKKGKRNKNSGLPVPVINKNLLGKKMFTRKKKNF